MAKYTYNIYHLNHFSKLKIFIIYILFLSALGLPHCVGSLSSCGK